MRFCDIKFVSEYSQAKDKKLFTSCLDIMARFEENIFMKVPYIVILLYTEKPLDSFSNFISRL
jgi:hypothetical protein